MLIKTKPKSFNMNSKKKVLEGPRSEILKVLKEAAKSGCSKCFGRGYTYYTEDKNGSKHYAPCPKCINGKINIT